MDDTTCAVCAATSQKESSERACSDIQEKGALKKHGPSREKMLSKEQYQEALVLVLCFVMALLGILLHEGVWQFPGSMVFSYGTLGLTYGIAAFPVLRGAWRNIRRGKVFDELFLMSIASLGALLLGAWEEAVGVMVFYRIGEFLQEYAVLRSRRSIRSLIALRPSTVRIQKDEEWIEVPPETVPLGSRILLRSGERLALDSRILEGRGTFDTSAITGESLPKAAEPGEEALAGYILKEGTLILRSERAYTDSTLARILHLVEKAQERKAPVELFVSRFARYYTPVVVILALLVALLPPLVVPGALFHTWVYRALVMLVISCPCAFVLSVPLTYFAGLGGMARRGILLKGAVVLDTLVKLRTVVFDKTGTLTRGEFQVSKLQAQNPHSAEELLTYATVATVHSNHPLSRAIQQHWERRGLPLPQPDEGSFYEIPGHGSVVSFKGKEVLAGNDRLLHLKEIPHTCREDETTTVHVALAGELVGSVHLEDQLKQDAPRVVRELKKRGVQHIALFTGDSAVPAQQAGTAAGVDEVHHSLRPEEKLERLERLMEDREGAPVAFVGDGINDGPVLARSDVGIAMGKGGSDLAIEQAEVVLMTDDLSRIPEAVDRARKTRRILWQNILFALGVKLAVLTLGAFGEATMWEGVLADVGVALLAVLNALRAYR
ncbi:MAG TPA: heavy metal translocating P-type ATPase [Termitinemataceae bacterium]|nr:heavy metal translocating P-type ATPase [Termitinemataceae bacterium]HOM23390.1 heavy metal translocating P-type ATPase [Termitinemataceae bacterium]HPQ01253.1 heavy metal translocating P-type ATPase [Termitinemataceae bacterium]